MRIDQEPLFLVFLDLWISYKILDRSRILLTLEGYRASLKIRGLLVEIW